MKLADVIGELAVIFTQTRPYTAEMVPDLQPPESRNAETAPDHDSLRLFELVDDINCAPPFDPPPASTDILNDHRTPNSIDIKSTHQNSLFWPHLKAVPLASYYQLHRVPSYPTMSQQPQQNGVHEIPRSDTPSSNGTPNGVHNKLLDQVIRTPGRQPSPQPTHLSVPGSSQGRVLHEEGSGYVAPKFEGKETQMDQGKLLCL